MHTRKINWPLINEKKRNITNRLFPLVALVAVVRGVQRHADCRLRAGTSHRSLSDDGSQSPGKDGELLWSGLHPLLPLSLSAIHRVRTKCCWSVEWTELGREREHFQPVGLILNPDASRAGK